MSLTSLPFLKQTCSQHRTLLSPLLTTSLNYRYTNVLTLETSIELPLHRTTHYHSIIFTTLCITLPMPYIIICSYQQLHNTIITYEIFTSYNTVANVFTSSYTTIQTAQHYTSPYQQLHNIEYDKTIYYSTFTTTWNAIGNIFTTLCISLINILLTQYS